MNKNCFIDPNAPSRSFWKTRTKSKLVKCVSGLDLDCFVFDHPEISQINFMYLDCPLLQAKGKCSSMEQIESLIDSSFLSENISRHNHRDIFESVRKYKKSVYATNDFDIVKNRFNDIVSMIEKWRYSQKGGMKYGWVEHAGIDKACIKRYIENPIFRSQVDFYLFIDKKSSDIVGYSMIEKTPYVNNEKLFEFPYLIRKCLVEDRRNITEYIDWWTFNETMQKNRLSNMIVNWGCSSGGVHWYKTHKWPLYRLEKKWFYTWKKK